MPRRLLQVYLFNEHAVHETTQMMKHQTAVRFVVYCLIPLCPLRKALTIQAAGAVIGPGTRSMSRASPRRSVRRVPAAPPTHSFRSAMQPRPTVAHSVAPVLSSQQGVIAQVPDPAAAALSTLTTELRKFRRLPAQSVEVG